MKTLVAFTGSARSASFHTRLIKAMPGLAPDDVRIAMFDLSGIPFYNEDLEGDAQTPVILALRAAVTEADGIIFAAPEYNGSFSALTKNTIDWLSRPMGQGVLRDKKVMVVSVTPGPGGGKRVSEQVSTLMGFFGNTVVGTVTAAAVRDKIAADSDTVVDADLEAQLRAALAAF